MLASRSVRMAVGATSAADPEQLRFLSRDGALKIAQEFGSPVFVYDEATLKAQAAAALAFPNAYGLTVRFAMKALPNAAVLQTFDRMGLHVDASSSYEVHRAIAAGISPDRISLSSQELAHDLDELLKLGIKFNACSLLQLRAYGALRPGSRGVQLGVRFNPGLGSGGTGKTNVGGPSSSFGIWHELMPQVKEILAEFDLEPARVHTHIGSGSDPAVWTKVSGLSLGLCEQLPSVSSLNLGGGYKVGRMATETSTNLATVGSPVKDAFAAFAARTGRELSLEIEPGTFLVANSGALLTTVQDIVTTGDDGHEFLKFDSGMTELLRPSLYGAQHPIILVTKEASAAEDHSYIAVGHCCESGDLVTPAPDEPETLLPRVLGGMASIGDLCVVEGAGAYCSSMCTKNYNSFPEAAEVMIDTAGVPHLVRRRQPLEEIWANEVPFTPTA
uniref:Diaminopimelate decarboxylase n=1 Tax=Coccolithus braarudii TaxID=221442 RepID=A0A7S0LI85_9EUKA